MRWARWFVVALSACSARSERAPTPPAPSASASALAAPVTSAADVTRANANVSCSANPDVAIWSSPERAWAGTPLRVVAVADKPFDAELVVSGPDGAAIARSSERRGTIPSSWIVEIDKPPDGSLRAALVGDGGKATCVTISVGRTAPPPPRASADAVWPVRRAWDRATENLYSAWIEKLFDAPLDEQPSWPALHEVLRDPRRNFLHDHLGAREDDAGPHAQIYRPDCADLPFTLRAYFAFKLGLPFGFHSCSRGGHDEAPRCFHSFTNLEAAPAKAKDAIGAFGTFVRTKVADTVHSGTGRTAAEDDNTDYYPVPLRTETLRPGTVYADPYGHTLVLAHLVPQTATAGGLLFAVDGQPDGTVARKRFWRGNFLFALGPALGGPGFKHFRPIVVEHGKARALTNAEIAKNPTYGDYSLQQYEGGVEGFYDKMDDVLSPSPLDPTRAMKETIDALEEQVRTRVNSVDNGVKYLAKGGALVDMPEGAAIFETNGAWEDFSTPSRDLRLLIAIDVVTSFPQRVARRPERYAMPSGKPVADVRAELEGILKTELDRRRVAYAREDGSSFELSLADVVRRAADLEMAYNPNDCPEVRWGAAVHSDEAKTCRHHAPADQVTKMRKYRAWFHERRRPPRP